MTDTYDTSTGKPVIKKDPNAVLDYSIDLTAWLALVPGDTVSSVVWSVSSGLTKTAQSNTTTSVTAWLSGGVVGATEWAQARFTTAQGRTDDRTLYFQIVDR